MYANLCSPQRSSIRRKYIHAHKLVRFSRTKNNADNWYAVSAFDQPSNANGTVVLEMKREHLWIFMLHIADESMFSLNRFLTSHNDHTFKTCSTRVSVDGAAVRMEFVLLISALRSSFCNRIHASQRHMYGDEKIASRAYLKDK